MTSILLKHLTHIHNFKSISNLEHCITFLLLCLFMNCCKISSNDHSEVIHVDIIHPEYVNFEDLIEDVQCIPLETSAQSYLESSSKVLYNGKYFYIWSLSDFAVCIFNPSGKLVKRIDNSTPGKGRVETPSDIFFNAEGLLSIPENRKYLMTYSLSGDFISREDLPSPMVKIIPWLEKSYLCYDGGFNRSSDYFLSISNLSSSESQQRFLYKPSGYREKATIPATLFTQDMSNGDIYTLLPNSDTIYYSSSAKNIPLKAAYHLQSDGLLFTKEMYPDKGFSDEEYSRLLKKNKHIFSVHSFYQAADKLFFRLKGKYNHYIAIDTKTHQTVAFQTMFDGINPYTPESSIQGASRNSLFFVFKTSELSNHYKKLGKTPSYESIHQVISTQNIADNMVIVMVNLK